MTEPLRPGGSPANRPEDERGRDLAALILNDRDAARAFLAALPVEQQARTICELPVTRRIDALGLVADLGRVVPRIAEIDLCATLIAHGPERSGWVLAHATGEQIVACLDLDAWRGSTLERGALESWLHGLADAGDRTLLRATRALDTELLAVWARHHFEFFFRPGEDEDWEPPDDTRTLDGEYHFRPRHPDEDLDLPLRVLHLLFENDQPLYLALVHNAAEGTTSVDEEDALRWRAGRLIDLGFPLREEALAVYAWLDPETLAALPRETPSLEVSPLPAVPARPLLPFPIFEAVAALPPEEREQALLAFMLLSNKVLVAEEMSLGDADAVRQAMERAAALTSRGLELMAERNELDEPEVLRRVSLDYLFRVGASLTGANTELLRRTSSSTLGD